MGVFTETVSREQRSRLAALIVGLTCFALAFSGSTAFATFPGANGRIAFVGDMPGCHGICAIDPDGSKLRQLTSFGSEPSWSANGRRVVFHDRLAIYTMRANGTDRKKITGLGGTILSADFSPTGHRIVYLRGRNWGPPRLRRAIYTVRTDGTDPRLVFASKTSFQLGYIPYPATPEYSPSGKRIVFVGKPVHRAAGIWTIRPDGSHLRNVTIDPATSSYADYYPDWSPGGGRIAFLRFDYCDGRTCFGQTKVIRPDGSGLYDTGLSERSRYAPSGNRLISWNLELDPDTSEFGLCSDIIYSDTAGANVKTVTHNCKSYHRGGPSAFAVQPSWQPLPGG